MHSMHIQSYNNDIGQAKITFKIKTITIIKVAHVLTEGPLAQDEE